ncbi:MAG: lipocalin family protein [Bacteroidota bacterium]
MKKYVSFLLVILLFSSCSNDDDGGSGDGGDPNGGVNIVGDWGLTGYVLGFPVDVNLDGIPNTDVLQELPCFDSTLTLNSDGTFTSSTTEIVITVDEGVTSADCGDLEFFSGAWQLVGDQLTIPDGNGGSQTVSIILSGNTMTYTSDDPAFGSSSATWTWTRQ